MHRGSRLRNALRRSRRRGDRGRQKCGRDGGGMCRWAEKDNEEVIGDGGVGSLPEEDNYIGADLDGM